MKLTIFYLLIFHVILFQVRALDIYDADTVEIALKSLAVRLVEFNEYPGRTVWLENVLWFHSLEHPLFREVLIIDKFVYNTYQSYPLDDEKTKEIRKYFLTALSCFQQLAEMFFKPGDIEHLTMMAKKDHFGYRPEIEVEMYIVLRDALTDLKEKPVRVASKILTDISDLTKEIAEDLRQLQKSSISRAVSNIRKKFDRLFDKIDDFEKMIEPFETAQIRLRNRIKKAYPLRGKPELGHPVDVTGEVQRFRTEFRDRISEKVMQAFQTLWTENNKMNTDLEKLLLKTTAAFDALIEFKEHQWDKYYQVINLSFQGIMSVARQICAQMQKFNAKIYYLVRLDINNKAHRSDDTIIHMMKSDSYNFAKLFADGGIMLNDALQITATLFTAIYKVLPSFDQAQMRQFNVDYQIVMTKLRDVHAIVIATTDPILDTDIKQIQ